MTDAITLNLTPAEHAHILLRLGRGTGSTIRPGESLSAQQELELVEKVERAVDAKSMSSLRDDAEALHDSLFKDNGYKTGASSLEEVSAILSDGEDGFYKDLWARDAGRIARLVKYVLDATPSQPRVIGVGST